MPILDLESMVSIKEMLEDSKGGQVDVDPTFYFARFALNTSLTLNYGCRIHGDVNSELLKEITYVEREISNFRSTSNNWQDYVPLLRIWSKQNSSADEFRVRRDTYLTKLLNDLKQDIANGTDKPCITGNILKDPDAKLNEGEILSHKRRTDLQNADRPSCFSRNQIHMPHNGLCRTGYCTWKLDHGHGISLNPTWTSYSGKGSPGNRRSLPERRSVGALPYRGKGPVRHSFGQGDSSLLDRYPNLPASHQSA